MADMHHDWNIENSLSLVHKVTSQDLLLEEIGLILLGLLGELPYGLLHGRDRRGTLVAILASSGILRGDGATDGRGTLGTGAEGLGPVEAFA